MVSEDEDRGNNIIITVFLLYFHLEDKSGRGKERENEKLNPYVIIHFPQQVGWKKKKECNSLTSSIHLWSILGAKRSVELNSSRTILARCHQRMNCGSPGGDYSPNFPGCKH